jgi:hypothetical protein
MQTQVEEATSDSIYEQLTHTLTFLITKKYNPQILCYVFLLRLAKIMGFGVEFNQFGIVGELRIDNEELRMENGELRIENGEWRIGKETDKFGMRNEELGIGGQLRIENG